MVKTINIKIRRILIGKRPTDVVMAAHIVHPSGMLRQIVTESQRLLQQIYLARGQRIPQ